ncbi:S8 family serine peptidase, partial [Candidatus Peregrinibacteria bacterium]|nr:S8 family serine peptidase [Candidatus Peregrinibacteria bacterium]
EAYDIASGGTSKVVAVVDSGILLTHVDLSANLWDGSSGCVDENNLVISGACPSAGWDFVNDDSDPSDDHGHGTHVAGVIGAVGNNSTGISGVAQTTRLMNLKVLNSSGFGSVSDIVRAINFAENNGADIINMSLSGSTGSQSEQDAIDAFSGIVVASAGNGGGDQVGDDNDTSPQYPASYDSTNIVSVAATDNDDALASFSNYGDVSVDLGAPGVNIYSTSRTTNSSYAYASGTSSSAPYVSGAAAVLWNYNTGLTSSQLKNIIVNSGDAISSLSGKTVSGRRLNLNNALATFDPVVGYTADDVIPATQISQSTDGDGLLTVNFRLKDGLAGMDATLSNFEYSVDGGTSFNAPTNGDNSASLSTNWDDNSYITATDFAGTVYSFTFNTKHGDVSGLDDVYQGDVQIRFKANDGVLTGSFATSESFSVDDKSPTLSGISDDSTIAKTKSWTWDSDDTGASYRYLLQLESAEGDLDSDCDAADLSAELYASDTKSASLSSGDGKYCLNVQSKDSIANESAVSVVSVTLDNTSPVVTGLSDDSTATNSKTLSWGATDASSVTYRFAIDQDALGVASGDYASSTSTSQNSGNGTYYIHVQAQDVAGNVSAVASSSFLMDTTAPVIDTLSDDLTARSSKAWTWDSDDAAATYRYSVVSEASEADVDNLCASSTPTGAYSSSKTVSYSSLGDGTYCLNVQAQDIAGNVSSVETASFLMDTAPNISGLTDDAGPVQSKSWTWDSDDSSALFRFKVVAEADEADDGSECAVADLSAETYSADTTSASQSGGNGVYCLSVQAKDVSSPANEGAAQVYSVLLDNTAPTAILSGTPASGTTSTSATITVAGTGVSHYKYSLDGAVYSSEAAVGSSISLSGLGTGSHTLNVIGRDAAGNYQATSAATSHSWTITSSGGGSGGSGGGSSGGGGASSGGSSSSSSSSSSDDSDDSDDESRTFETVDDADFENSVISSEPVVVSGGGISNAVTLEGEDGSLAIGDETMVQRRDGSAFSGEIKPPRLVTESSLPRSLSAALNFGNAIEIETGDQVFFDKKVKLSMKIPVGINFLNPKIFYFDENKDAYVLVGGELSQDGDFVEVLVDHLTLFVLVDYDEPFSDVVGHWSQEFVKDLFELGVVQGRSEGLYEPDSSLTRAELTKIALLTFDYEILSGSEDFSDVNADDWFYPYVVTAKTSGIVSGYGDGTFRPAQAVNRAEALKILLEAAKLKTGGVLKSPFTDVSTADWFAQYVDFAFSSQIVSGKSEDSFAPGDLVTRAEMAKMAIRTFEL